MRRASAILVSSLVLSACPSSPPPPRFAVTGHEDADLQRLAETCVPDAVPLGSPHFGRGEAGGPTERLTFVGGGDGRCLRVLAVGGAGVVDLDVALLDASGALLTRDRRPGMAIVAPAADAVCLPSAQPLTLEVRVADGRGPYAVGVVALDERAMASACRE